jgi:hypothetical protein
MTTANVIKITNLTTDTSIGNENGKGGFNNGAVSSITYQLYKDATSDENYNDGTQLGGNQTAYAYGCGEINNSGTSSKQWLISGSDGSFQTTFNISNAGSGYSVTTGFENTSNGQWQQSENITSAGTNISTTGGNGSGLTVRIEAVDGGSVTSAAILNCGEGYEIGDVLTISGGNGDATITLTKIACYPLDFPDATPDNSNPAAGYSDAFLAIPTIDFNTTSGSDGVGKNLVIWNQNNSGGSPGQLKVFFPSSNDNSYEYPLGTSFDIDTYNTTSMTSGNRTQVIGYDTMSEGVGGGANPSTKGIVIGWDDPQAVDDYYWFFKVGSLCFPGFTKILLADGTQTEIKDLKRLDLIQTSTGPKPLAQLNYTQCPFGKDYVHIPSNYFGKNLPSEDLYVTKAHPLSLGVINQETKAENPETEYLHLVSKELLALDGINIVHLEEDYYNIVFDTQEEINVQNVKYLSHHPNHKPQKTYRLPDKLVVNKRAETEYKPTFTTLSKFLEQCPEDVAPKDFLAQTIRF